MFELVATPNGFRVALIVNCQVLWKSLREMTKEQAMLAAEYLSIEAKRREHKNTK